LKNLGHGWTDILLQPGCASRHVINLTNTQRVQLKQHEYL